MKNIPASPGVSSGLQNMQLSSEREQIAAYLRSGEPTTAGRPIARRQSVDNGEAVLQSLQHQVSDLEKQLTAAQSKDDIAAAPGAFSADVHRQLFAQRRFEKSATADLFGNQSWTRMRRNQLNRTSGGKLAAAQYGLGFAHDGASGKPPFARLEVGNPMTGSYQRMSPSVNTQQICNALYKKRHAQALQKPLVYTNGEFMASNVVSRYKLMNPQHGDISLQEVAPGIHAINCNNPNDWQALEALVDKFGARPSPYQVMRNMVAGNGGVEPPVNDPQVLNQQQVAFLGDKGADGVLSQLQSVPENLSTHTLARSDADMIDGLMNILAMPQIAERHQHNPLLAQGLKGMRFIAESMPALATDSTRFGNAHRALMEEMQIVLTAVRPYSANAFRLLASQRIREALPPESAAKMLPAEACLLSSGMQALTQGLEAALGASRGGGLEPLTNGDKRTPFYYEAQNHVDSFNKPTAQGKQHSPALYTSLADSVIPHTSQPNHNWGVSDIIAGIQQKIAERRDPQQPLDVVIDSTIEKADDMKTLLAALGPALGDNQLRLFICKSHQKFANLGASKVMGGNITLLAAQNPANNNLRSRLQSTEANLGWFNNDESQMMTHLTRTGVRQEPAFLQTAIDNGNFVAQHCFHGQDGHTTFAGHDPSQPFAMLPAFADSDNMRWPGISIYSGSDDESDSESDSGSDMLFRPQMVLNNDLIRGRSSFGFTESTISGVGRQPGYDDEMGRLSFGQENKPELIERFWMASREMQLDRPPITSVAALELAEELVEAALTPEQNASLAHASLSDKLRQVGKNEAAPVSDALRNHGSINELRGNAAISQGFTLNKVASIVGHLNFILKTLDLHEEMAFSDDRQPLRCLLNGLIDSGMPGVSATAREQVIGLKCALSHEDMQNSDPEVRRYGAEDLLSALTDSNISPSLGIHGQAIPDPAWNEQPAAMQDKLVNAVFGRLDTGSQLEFLHKALSQGQGLQFVQACAMQLAGQLKNTGPAETRQHWQATINEAMVRRGIIQAAPPGRPS